MADHQIQPEKRIDDLLLERQRLDQDIKQRYGKTVAIMFSDICGYTQYTEKKGDLLSRYMLLRHNQIVFPAVERNLGKVIQVMGDGILAVFNAPLDAVTAAVDIHRCLDEANREIPVDEAIHVKIGVNMGEVLLDEETEVQGLTGDAANVAARLQDYAGKDGILISRAVHGKIEREGQWLCRFHGDVMFKGKTVSTPVYRVIWKDAKPGWDDAPPIGSKPAGQTDETPSKAETDGPIVTLEISREGDELSISMHEKNMGEESTLRHYESIACRTETIEKHRKVLVKVLNKANRQGQVSVKTLNRLREIGQALYDELLSFNVKERLNQTKAEILILSIDDQLVQIPWELLYDGKQFFCMRFSMGRVVKTRQTPASNSDRPLEAPLNMLVLADPTGDLKNASAEGSQICDFLNQRPELIKAAMPKISMSAETLKAKLRNYDLIHFAGHAHHSMQDPASGGWRLQDSSLTTDDIARMAGGATMPTMVFANACQSASTEQWLLDDAFEHQIFGLANAFLLAGVKHYIGTFWEIMDEPGSHFAIEFYKQLFSGKSVGRAVLEARRALVSLYGEETIIWASYVFYGDPTFDYSAHIKEKPSQEVEKSDKDSRTRPILKDLYRDKRADPDSGHSWSALLRLGMVSIAVVIAVSILWMGSSWRRTRAVEDLEQRALSHSLSGEDEEAVQICRQLQTDVPERPTSALILGNIHFSRGKLNDARKYFQLAAEQSTGSKKVRIKALLGLGRLASLESRPEDAMTFYQKASIVDPDNALAISAQAVLWERQGDLGKAYRAYHRAAFLSPDEDGFQVAADQVKAKLDFMQDETRQARIDQLVRDILSEERSAPPGVESEWSSEPLTLWLLDFKTEGMGMQEGKERLIYGQLGNSLIYAPRIKLVERAFLDKLLSELKLGSSPLADREAALAVGRLVSAKILLIGRIMHLHNRLQATVRLVECETGVVIDSIIEEFDRHAVPQRIAHGLSAAIVNAVHRHYPLRAKVTTIGHDLAVIDVGRYQGAATGIVLKGPQGKVAVRIRSVSHHDSKVDITAGKEHIRSGLKLEADNSVAP